MKTVIFETHYKVISAQDGVEGEIDIGPDKDGLDLVEVRVADPDFFGPCNLTMNHETARALAKALMAAADDAEVKDRENKNT